MTTAQPRTPRQEFIDGIVTVVVMDIGGAILVLAAAFILGMGAEAALPKGVFQTRVESFALFVGALGTIGIGLTQWLWLYPAIRKARRDGHPERVKGIATAGGIISLLSATCFGVMGIL